MSSYTISPLRFTPNLSKMNDFFLILGINKVLERKDRYILFTSDSGYVALHHCSNPDLAGKTQFELVTPNIETATKDLESKGITPLSWDEAYTKYLGVQNPYGHWVWISEFQTDTYGYQNFPLQHQTENKLTVTAVCFSADFSQDKLFFNNFGFQPLKTGDENWQELSVPTSSLNNSSIGIHSMESSDYEPSDSINHPTNYHSPLYLSCEPTGAPVMSTWLSFNTTEPLENLADKLTKAGYTANIMSAHGITNLVTFDPDGARIEIHPII